MDTDASNAWAALIGIVLVPGGTAAAQVAVRHTEGWSAGFWFCARWRGDTRRGRPCPGISRGRVTSRMVFHFKDGSLNDETVVYTQRTSFPPGELSPGAEGADLPHSDGGFDRRLDRPGHRPLHGRR